MKSIQHFINPNHTFEEIHRVSESLDICSSSDNNASNFILHTLKSSKLFCPTINKKLTYLIGDFNFKEILLHANEPVTRGSGIDRIFQDNFVGYYKGRYNNYYDDSLMEKLEEEFEKRNIIFINTTLQNFSIDEEEEEKYSTHGICFIFVPVAYTNKYNLYYINSHGDALEDEDKFEYYHTRSRKGEIEFDKPLEFVMVETFVKYLRHRLKINIQYETTKEFNYIGVNLQEFDNQGMCFAYPVLIYYYFGCHYDTGKTITNGKVNQISETFYNMLMSGDLDKMIYYCYADYSNKLTEILIKHNSLSGEKLYNRIINCLKKENFRFVKKISHGICYFMNQEYFLNKIKGKYICQDQEA